MVRERQKKAKPFVRRSLLTFLSPYSTIAEQYRTIRNNIQYAVEGNNIQSLLITSPSGGEGKSTTVVNLAASMAQRGDRVLIIDANLRDPNLHKQFNTQISPGLSNILAKQQPIEDTIQPTEIEGLDILPSGQRLNHSTEQLDSVAMLEVLDYAKGQYDIVLVDCPSVLDVPDTCALASICDGVVLLVKKGKTKLSLAEEAKRSLEFAKANIVGVVLNQKSG